MNSGCEKDSKAGKGDSLRKKDQPGVFSLLHHVHRIFQKNILIHSLSNHLLLHRSRPMLQYFQWPSGFDPSVLSTTITLYPYQSRKEQCHLYLRCFFITNSITTIDNVQGNEYTAIMIIILRAVKTRGFHYSNNRLYYYRSFFLIKRKRKTKISSGR